MNLTVLNSSKQFSAQDRHPVKRNVPQVRGSNIVQAGNHNRRVILHHLRSSIMTRQELTAATGLTVPAVSAITKRLVEDELLSICGKIRGERGQPAAKYALNPDGAFSLGLNVDRDHLTLVLMDFTGKIRGRKHLEEAFALPSRTRDFVEHAVDELCPPGSRHLQKLVGFGISIPDELGSIHVSSQPKAYAAWCAYEVEKLVPGHIRVPIFRENDAASAAIGELHFGAGVQTGSFFYVLLTAGLGGGLVIDRRYIRGAHGRSGEIGFLPRFHPFRSRLSNRKETLGDALLLESLFDRLNKAGVSIARPDQLRDSAINRQPVVEEWLDEVSDLLYLPLLTLVCGIDPNCVLIGGRLPKAINDRLSDHLNRKLSMNVDLAWTQKYVRSATLSEDASAMGAAVLPFLSTYLVEGSPFVRCET